MWQGLGLIAAAIVVFAMMLLLESGTDSLTEVSINLRGDQGYLPDVELTGLHRAKCMIFIGFV